MTTTELGRRADARRNVELILTAAEARLAEDPDASMSDIARTAGLGRVTLYGHFTSRQELVGAVVVRVLAEADAALVDLDLSGDPVEALRRLIAASWRVTARSGSLLVAAERALPAAEVRDLHGNGLEQRVRALLLRGRREGAFRSDLSPDWMVATLHAVVHAAATEAQAGRLEPADGAAVVTSTMLGMLRPPPTGAEGPVAAPAP